MKTLVKPANKKARSRPLADGAIEVTRHVTGPVQLLLWGRSAGRCQFAGCNKPLWKSPLTQEQVNIAQKAHIYAFSSAGPRGNRNIPKKDLNAVANLMLVCHGCHKKIDKEKDGGRYSVALLQGMKAQHERRIEIVTAIAPSKQSHVMLYGANIGQHTSPLNFSDTALALFPHRYPAEERPIELTMVDNAATDRDADFWQTEAKNVVSKFSQRVRERLAQGELRHLSVFALAPQPLLMLLGSLLTDIPRAEVFQLHREPAGWAWPTVKTTQAFSIKEPPSGDGPAALVLSLSATVVQDRITSVLGPDARIWTVTMPKPNNDFTKSKRQLAEFRSLIRPLLDRIKARHGQNAPLHIFPAASVSAALELGRIRQPKADMPWTIYDQVNDRGGFIRALSLPFGDEPC